MGNGTQQSGGPGRGPSFNQASVLVVDYDRLALAADGYDVSVYNNGGSALLPFTRVFVSVRSPVHKKVPAEERMTYILPGIAA